MTQFPCTDHIATFGVSTVTPTSHYTHSLSLSLSLSHQSQCQLLLLCWLISLAMLNRLLIELHVAHFYGLLCPLLPLPHTAPSRNPLPRSLPLSFCPFPDNDFAGLPKWQTINKKRLRDCCVQNMPQEQAQGSKNRQSDRQTERDKPLRHILIRFRAITLRNVTQFE